MESRQNSAVSNRTDKPAIGVVATDENVDAIARIIVRATARDFPILVSHDGTDSVEPLRDINRYSGGIIFLEWISDDREALERLLKTTAKAFGYPGLLFHETPTELIDFQELDDKQPTDYVGTAPIRSEAEVTQRPTLVAIPSYNEERSIGTVVNEVLPYAEEVIVVDDGSGDRTAARARQSGAEVLEHETNRGYGAALKTAFREANRRNAEWLVVLDGDGQHEASDISKLVGEIDDGADIVIGSRFADDTETDLPLYRLLGLMIINALTNLSMGVVRSRSWINDTQCGFRAYGPRSIDSLAADVDIGDKMNASTDILYHAHAKDYDIREIGTAVDYDVESASSQNPISHGLVLIKNILRTVEIERPVTVFGIPGVTTTVVGVGIGYWMLSDFLSTGTVSLALTLTAIFAILAGLLSTVTAIILHALSVHFQSFPSIDSTE